ncbi:DUF305 domain-containing protein [Amycolatopsis carbonis]|uniref:DUF305 domain-containing protein n=1 Tax=Amycolatopsis carbonis TaxID=715471 RepID=A0A9Y2IEY4_9PSEU|nr:DUF305 domain-containing protein [Amycolatopsis sp. 2-15]WIX79130.1 DUF305 domain-containing protein [Amycolatopsis sp. 2-15]
MNRKFLAGIAAPAIAAVLVGCSSPSAAPPAADHNAADVTFAQDMVPHHRQAVEMSGPVPQHTGDQRVITLAKQIQQAQQPEIDQLTAWLKAWGAPAPSTGMGGMTGMEHGQMPGLVDTAGLDELHDAAYDRKWLELMIQHHSGAVAMARTELAQGSSVDAKAMAQRIVDTQEAEITTMKSLLGG